MKKLAEMYNNLSIENKARCEGVLAVAIFYIVVKVIAAIL